MISVRVDITLYISPLLTTTLDDEPWCSLVLAENSIRKTGVSLYLSVLKSTEYVVSDSVSNLT